MTHEQMVKYCERNLENVIAAYSGDFRKEAYIEYARAELEAAKADRLMKFYDEHKAVEA